MHYETPPHGFRTFVIVWLTQSISIFGSALTHFAINIWLTQELYARPEQKPELAFALSANSLAFALPLLVAGPLAGAWADRYDRKRTMIIADVVNGCLSLVLVALVITQTLQLWMLLCLTVLFSVTGAFHFAAFDTSYAMLVEDKLLMRANGMMQSIWSLSGIVSPGIAAGLIALPVLARQGRLPAGLNNLLSGLSDGAALAMLIDAVSFFLVAIVLLFLHIPSPRRLDLAEGAGKRKKSIWADVREGAHYIWYRRPMLWLLGTFTVVNFVSAGRGVFVTLLVKFNLADDWAARGFTFETALALLGSVGSAGALLGGFLISTWGGFKTRRVYGVLIPMIISGVAQIIFGLSGQLYLTAAMSALGAFMIPIMNSHSQTIWQTQTPRELQGRVFAVRRLIVQFMMPMGTLMAGLIGGAFDPGMVMAVLGVVYTIFCIAQLFNPYLLRVEDKAWLDSLASRMEAKQALGGR